MNNQKYMKDIIKIAKSDGESICKGRKFKIHNLTLKDKFKSKRDIEILLYDGAIYHNSINDVNLKSCKLVIKLDGVIKYESDKGAFKNYEITYNKRGKFSFREFIRLNTPEFENITLKSVGFSSKIHENQYYTFRKLIACQIRLDNALRNFIQLNTHNIETYNS